MSNPQASASASQSATPADRILIPVWPHALPYRVIFGEYCARRSSASLQAVVDAWRQSLGESAANDGATAVQQIEEKIAAAEAMYETLKNQEQELRRISKQTYKYEEDRLMQVAKAHQAVLDAAAQCRAADAPLKSLLHRLAGSALCLSGGGVRSASFCLGVIQGLARFGLESADGGLLPALDYISTVSGGGYIGSWMMGWAARSRFTQVVRELATSGATAGDPEPGPLRHLRDYTSYLAPRYGFTVDTTTLLAITLRNLFLNWLIFLPSLVFLLLLPQAVGILGDNLIKALVYWDQNTDPIPGAGDQKLMILAACLISVAGVIAAYRAWDPPTTSEGKERSWKITSEGLFLFVVLVAAWLITEAWWIGRIAFPGVNEHIYERFNATRVHWLIGDLAFASLPMSMVRLIRVIRRSADPLKSHAGRIVWSFVAPLVSSTATALVLELVCVRMGPLFPNPKSPTALFQAFAVPLVLTVLMLGSSLLTGLLSIVEQEEEREWWARAGGALMMVTGAWCLLGLIGWYVPELFHRLGFSLWALASMVFGFSASGAGKSAASTVGMKQPDMGQLSSVGKLLAKYNLLAPVLSFIALFCISVSVASFKHHLLRDVRSVSGVSAAGAIAIVLAGAAMLAWLANLCVNANTFSLHGMYRMRLVRAFLGASNFGRDADRFTNFDINDNLADATLGVMQDAPIHLVNTALNLVSTRKNAWQQRKAESFSFTPFHSGSWRLGYAKTSAFGGNDGVTLGTAMAISGAAVNPNMGYNSSPLVTLLMTMFNARLGWWLPNPGWPAQESYSDEKARRYLRKTGPTLSLVSIVNEALGRTNDQQKWIQLSDGGHFDNLGLYEMVLRRCRTIIVVDASADRTAQLEDLGNSIRKILIDLGIPIVFDGPDPWPFSEGQKESNLACAVATIQYGCVDEGASPGHLVYIKPSLNGKEPRDISAYAGSHSAFPHETTINQFFTESQFESYRHLGSFEAEEIGENCTGSDGSIASFVQAALRYTKQSKPEAVADSED